MRTAEARSLAYHQAVAARLRREPELLARVRTRVEEWLVHGGRARAYAEAWSRILEQGLPAVLSVLEDERTERAIDLRHASPFAGLISPRERWRIWKETRPASLAVRDDETAEKAGS